MHDLIYFPEIDGKDAIQKQGLDKRKACLAWMPHTGIEIIVLSHKAEKIKLAGTVTTK